MKNLIEAAKQMANPEFYKECVIEYLAYLDSHYQKTLVKDVKLRDDLPLLTDYLLEVYRLTKNRRDIDHRMIELEKIAPKNMCAFLLNRFAKVYYRDHEKDFQQRDKDYLESIVKQIAELYWSESYASDLRTFLSAMVKAQIARATSSAGEETFSNTK